MSVAAIARSAVCCQAVPQVAPGVAQCRLSKAECAPGGRIGVGCGTQAVSAASQVRTCWQASPIGSGRSKTRGFVTNHRNATKLAYGRPTDATALTCCVNELT